MNPLNAFNSNSAKTRQKRIKENKIQKQTQTRSAFSSINHPKSKHIMPKSQTNGTKHYNSAIKPLNIYDSEYKSARITLLQLARLNAIQNIKGINSRSKTIKMLLDDFINSNYNDSEKRIMRTFEKGFIRQHK